MSYITVTTYLRVKNVRMFHRRLGKIIQKSKLVAFSYNKFKLNVNLIYLFYQLYLISRKQFIFLLSMLVLSFVDKFLHFYTNYFPHLVHNY